MKNEKFSRVKEKLQKKWLDDLNYEFLQLDLMNIFEDAYLLRSYFDEGFSAEDTAHYLNRDYK